MVTGSPPRVSRTQGSKNTLLHTALRKALIKEQRVLDAVLAVDLVDHGLYRCQVVQPVPWRCLVQDSSQGFVMEAVNKLTRTGLAREGLGLHFQTQR